MDVIFDWCAVVAMIAMTASICAISIIAAYGVWRMIRD